MLPRFQRLNLKTDFKWVTTGKKIETKFTRIFFKNGDNVLPRLGIALSGKVFRKATQRNRVKRLISQAFACLYNLLPGHINIVVLPKSEVIGVKSPEVLLDLEKGLKNEKIL
ncbi:ribonuclease P protein component [Candidatus Daviesbacteria bacterium]|nr:ribonuclease P protein component [Candidatus Daviesbacteria bacterium]